RDAGSVVEPAILFDDVFHLQEVLFSGVQFCQVLFYRLPLHLGGGLERMYQGKGDPTLFQVSADVLSESPVARRIVEQVVGELEGHAHMETEVAKGDALFMRHAAEEGTYLTGGGEQHRRLAGN